MKLFEEKYKNDTAAQRIWKQFHNGVRQSISIFLSKIAEFLDALLSRLL